MATPVIRTFFVCNVSHAKGKVSTAKQTCLDSPLGPELNSYCVMEDSLWRLPCQLDLLCPTLWRLPCQLDLLCHIMAPSLSTGLALPHIMAPSLSTGLALPHYGAFPVNWTCSATLWRLPCQLDLLCPTLWPSL